MRTPVIFLVFFILFSQQVYAQDQESELETIQINCNTDESYDLKSNKNKKTTGEFSLNIVISDTLVNNGKFTAARAYGKDILCDDFFGFSNNSEFKLNCENTIKQQTITENITINRLSGSFDNIFMIDDDIKVIFSGTCSKAKKVF